MIYQSWYWSDHLAEVVFVSFLHSKMILFIIINNCYYHHHIILFFIIYFVEGSYYVYSTRKSGKLCSSTWEWEAMLINLRVECLHNFFEILLHGRFLFLLGLFVCFFFRMLFIYLRERGEKNYKREGQMEKDKQVPCWTGSLPWDLDHDLSLRQ